MLRNLLNSRPFGLATASLLLVGSMSCRREPPPPQMPPMEVEVTHPIEREVTNYLYYNGVTKGYEENEIRPRVAGYLQEINFTPDSQVKRGDLLFTIDQQPFKVAVQRAQAELEGKRATVASTNANLQRVKKLVAQQAASDQELIERQAAFDLAVADVGVAESALQKAKDDLGYTEIRAGIPGRIGRNLVDKGTLLKADDVVMATIVNDEKIFVDFNVSETEFLDYIRKNPWSRTTDASNTKPVVVELGMADEEGFPHFGRVTSGANKVNQETGTYAVRALFDNPNRQIASGLFVRVRTVMETAPSILVPDVALQADPRGQFVYVVNDKNAIERRAVVTGTQIGPFRRIVSGVKPTDKVVTNGLMMIHAESIVNPKLVEPPPMPAAPATRPTLPADPATSRPADNATTQPDESATQPATR
jgi:RND family efflux transporter MFP subunit